MSIPNQQNQAQLPVWAKELFKNQSTPKGKTAFVAGWGNNGDLDDYKNEEGKLVSGVNFDYFDPDDGVLGQREIRYNKNLLNPDEFARYWQTGKHKGYRIYKDIDKDGDNEPDMIAVNPDNHVVGFNERYVVEGQNAETPYRRAYYALPKDARKAMSYQQFLMGQENKEGWKNLDKFKASRVKKPFFLICVYLTDELKNADVTQKEWELVGKKLLEIIASSFFDSSAPYYQVKAVMSTPEFKKVLENTITASNLPKMLPEAKKQEIVNGIVNSIRGYHDGNLKMRLKTYLDRMNNSKLSAAHVKTMYLEAISKKAATKIYKKNKLTPAYLASHPEEAAAFAQEVATERAELDKKYQMDDVGEF